MIWELLEFTRRKRFEWFNNTIPVRSVRIKFCQIQVGPDEGLFLSIIQTANTVGSDLGCAIEKLLIDKFGENDDLEGL